MAGMGVLNADAVATLPKVTRLTNCSNSSLRTLLDGCSTSSPCAGLAIAQAAIPVPT